MKTNSSSGCHTYNCGHSVFSSYGGLFDDISDSCNIYSNDSIDGSDVSETKYILLNKLQQSSTMSSPLTLVTEVTVVKVP